MNKEKDNDRLRELLDQCLDYMEHKFDCSMNIRSKRGKDIRQVQCSCGAWQLQLQAEQALKSIAEKMLGGKDGKDE